MRKEDLYNRCPAKGDTGDYQIRMQNPIQFHLPRAKDHFTRTFYSSRDASSVISGPGMVPRTDQGWPIINEIVRETGPSPPPLFFPVGGGLQREAASS